MSIYIILISLLYLILSRYKSSRELSPSLLAKIYAIANKYDIGKFVPIIEAIMLVESSGNINIPDGKAGERGLMQITKAAMLDVNEKFNMAFNFDELYAVIPNISCGILFFKLQLSRCENNLKNAIKSYNAGFVGATVFGFSNSYLSKVKKYLTEKEIEKFEL